MSTYVWQEAEEVIEQLRKEAEDAVQGVQQQAREVIRGLQLQVDVEIAEKLYAQHELRKLQAVRDHQAGALHIAGPPSHYRLMTRGIPRVFR